ncbi:MAG: response regulator [Polyangiaceae bacterium]
MNQEPVSSAREAAMSRILVIDDDAAVAKMIAHILRAAHEIVIEASPRAALARLRSGDRFDLILCDITMPEMSGIEVYETLAAADREQASRVAFMTGGGLSTEEDGFLSDVGVPRLQKPFRPAELRVRVRELISR